MMETHSGDDAMPDRSPRRLTVLALLLTGLGMFAARAGTPQPPARPFVRTGEVRELLQRACLECHGGKKTRGGLDLGTREALLRGGDSGPAVVPGDVKKSLLHRLVSHAE